MPGSPGRNGSPGRDGLDGFKGDKGGRGLPGEKGMQGERGDDGLKGVAGEKGERGAAGRVGSKGDSGKMGPHGPAGMKGIKGERGENGSKWNKGEIFQLNWKQCVRTNQDDRDTGKIKVRCCSVCLYRRLFVKAHLSVCISLESVQLRFLVCCRTVNFWSITAIPLSTWSTQELAESTVLVVRPAVPDGISLSTIVNVALLPTST